MAEIDRIIEEEVRRVGRDLGGPFVEGTPEAVALKNAVAIAVFARLEDRWHDRDKMLDDVAAVIEEEVESGAESPGDVVAKYFLGPREDK
jgi:hypothetical protein